MIRHIDRIVLTVADINRALAFYERVLQMTPCDTSRDLLVGALGDQKIQFQRLGDEMRNHSLEGSASIGIASDWTIVQVMEHLQQHQVIVLEGTVTSPCPEGEVKRVYFTDSYNNLLSISVTSASELHWLTPAPPLLVNFGEVLQVLLPKTWVAKVRK